MNSDSPELKVITYHYVRDLPNSEYPRLKARQIDDFREQLVYVRREMEMATLESALAFLERSYRPKRDLCLLTFDDGLVEHGEDITAILADMGVAGLFFLPTYCLEHEEVLPVHKNHFLMASLDLATYRDACLVGLNERGQRIDLDQFRTRAGATYPWDDIEAATLKYLLNYELAVELRDDLLRDVFCQYLGDESTFSRSLYVSWREARQMQSLGMILGGHSHQHLPLATLDDEAQRDDLRSSFDILRQRLTPQPHWPFAYPYGTPASYSPTTQRLVQETGFDCAFTTQRAGNQPGQARYALCRFDTNDVAWTENQN